MYEGRGTRGGGGVKEKARTVRGRWFLVPGDGEPIFVMTKIHRLSFIGIITPAPR
jgi:hypothetical protein